MTSTDRPQRRTRQRSLIAAALDGTDQWLTAQQVHRRLADDGHAVGLATVYRTLAALAASGGIDAVRSNDQWTYRRCSPIHHHHLTCRSCGRTVEVTAPPLEAWAADVAAAHGFTDIDHLIEVSGLCAACAEDRPG